MPASPSGRPVRPATIRTARLDLVPLRVEHADAMSRVLDDPALHTFIGGAPEDADALRARYRRVLAGSPNPGVSWCNWVIGLRAEDGAPLVGTVQATVVPGAPGSVAEIAWVVGTAWQRRGIATEAARGLVDWLAWQGVRTVVAHVHPDHGASAAVAAAAGLAATDTVQDGEIRWQSPPDGTPGGGRCGISRGGRP
ncbi:GNAT family N-acetyltransferase [Streptomyces alfalfae]|uniref:GNAT family N-acetyltransferase n=1 Tax=Streptomyces alfalfae TaxID=1642299 RepID=A0A7T4TW48_9ACTN|nr:GNAT family N-acetyltransferase [Streptomyces alfalfae]QQC87769.1 GNAT family N-acetyltransferase [Streptomyces alfalfae]